MTGRRSRAIGSRPDAAEAAPGQELERQWVERAAAGEEGAFRLLVELYQDRVYGVALRMLKDPDLAMDAAQDTFVKAWRGLGRFRARSRFGTWIYRIAVNVCYDRLAKSADNPAVALDDLIEQGQEPAADAAWADPADMETAQGAVAFQQALGLLSEAYRLAFILRQVEERSYPEIAEILGITVTNAKVRVHRAREALLSMLKKRGVL